MGKEDWGGASRLFLKDRESWDWPPRLFDKSELGSEWPPQSWCGKIGISRGEILTYPDFFGQFPRKVGIKVGINWGQSPILLNFGHKNLYLYSPRLRLKSQGESRYILILPDLPWLIPNYLDIFKKSRRPPWSRSRFVKKLGRPPWIWIPTRPDPFLSGTYPPWDISPMVTVDETAVDERNDLVPSTTVLKQVGLS